MSGSSGGPYRTDHLPPMPDSETGLPRPPHAPLWPTWVPGRPDLTPSHKPDPPPGLGPTLEHFKESHLQALAGALVVAAVVAAVTAARSGFGWVTDPWMWAIVLTPFPLFLLLRRIDIIAAGADWLLWKKKWVRTYELESVKLSPRGAQFNLIIRDRAGRSLSIPWRQLCDNRALWDLVYNGVLHSAHNGPFTSNREARRTLKLPR